jgi:hypothetical protein
MRYARKVDSSQAEIVKALRSAGVHVDIIGRPVDLLTYYRGRWLPIEIKPAAEAGIRVKTRTVRKRKDQEEQQEFCRTFGVPIVRTGYEALQAVLAHIQATGVKP